MEYYKYAVAINAVAPMRRTADEHSERIDEVLFGMELNVISSDGEWYYVKTYYNYEGYINKKDIILMDEVKFRKWKENRNFHVIQSIADILEGPKVKNEIVKTVTRGAFLCYTGENDGHWGKVVLPDEKSGWMRLEFFKRTEKYDLKNEEIIRKNLVETAKLYLNTQYRWGGKSTLGIDCSGLCSMVYLLNGFIIHRDAVLKEEYMKKIDIREIKPGDLIFFPGHVAMYIGNNEYIHSNAGSNNVAINSLDAKAYNFRKDLSNSILGVGTIFR